MPTEFTIEDRSFKAKSDVALTKKTTTDIIDESKLKIAFAALLTEYQKANVNNDMISSVNLRPSSITKF